MADKQKDEQQTPETPDKDASRPDTVPNPVSPPPTGRDLGGPDDQQKAKEIPESKEKTKVSASADKKDLLQIFCRRTGYQASDVLDRNDRTRTFVTSNGGKYQLTAKGVRHLQGPAIPKALEDED